MLAVVVAALCVTGVMTAVLAARQPASTVLAWGADYAGQLENGANSDQPDSAPAGVDLSGLPAGILVTGLAAGVGHSLAATSDGRVFAWGLNTFGQLGDGTTDNSSTPVEVKDLPRNITAVAAGSDHSLALTSDGRVFAWGYNEAGQLGDGTTDNRSAPVEVKDLHGDIIAVAAGGSHSLALTSGGRVFAWGDNGHGQLGDGTGNNRDTPVEVKDLPGDITVVAAGSDHSLALTSGGRVFAWGDNGHGKLGDGTTGNRDTPVEVKDLPADVTAVAGGAEYSLALTSDRRVLAWGANYWGQLGDGSTDDSSTPVEVKGLPADVTAIAAGVGHSVAMTSGGRVFAWGLNNDGQLGDGTTDTREMAVEAHLPEPHEFSRVTAIAAGWFRSLALEVRAFTVTTVTAALSRARYGEPVTVAAMVTCTTGTLAGTGSCAVGTPAGTVTFTDDGTVLAAATVHESRAKVRLTRLPPGRHEITARYNGNRSCPPSSSEPVTVTIAPDPSPSLPPAVPVTG